MSDKQIPKFVMWQGEPRQVEKEADDEYYWLVPTNDSSRAFAPKKDCTELPSDQELLIKPVSEMSDSELEMALELAEKQRMARSDRPAARIGRAKKKISSDEPVLNEKNLKFMAQMRAELAKDKEETS